MADYTSSVAHPFYPPQTQLAHYMPGPSVHVPHGDFQLNTSTPTAPNASTLPTEAVVNTPIPARPSTSGPNFSTPGPFTSGPSTSRHAFVTEVDDEDDPRPRLNIDKGKRRSDEVTHPPAPIQSIDTAHNPGLDPGHTSDAMDIDLTPTVVIDESSQQPLAGIPSTSVIPPMASASAHSETPVNPPVPNLERDQLPQRQVVGGNVQIHETASTWHTHLSFPPQVRSAHVAASSI